MVLPFIKQAYLSLAVFTAMSLFNCQPVAADPETYQAWIAAMKNEERGPFTRIRWFCKDGTVLPPQPFGCLEHGGGSQHGEWSERTRELRAAGYYIANIYSDLDIEGLMADTFWRSAFAQMLIEQFLIQTDDGWILHRARYYRGAYQVEGEQAGAQRLLLQLANPVFSNNSLYLQLRTAASLLHHGQDTTSAQSVRQLATAIAQIDPGFVRLRNKIHIRPQAGDAAQVMEYADGIADPELIEKLEELARLISALYTVDSTSVIDELTVRIEGTLPAFADRLRSLRFPANPESDSLIHYNVHAQTLKLLREIIIELKSPALRLRAIDASLVVEAEGFAVASSLAPQLTEMTRRELLVLLTDNIDTLYGAGLLSQRQYRSLVDSISGLLQETPSLKTYRRELRYLSLAPDWVNQSMNFLYRTGMEKMAEIEPRSLLFIQDLLRGSPLFFYARIIDVLLRDAGMLAGVRNSLFTEEVGIGLRALNPGLARGILYMERREGEEYDSNGIYVLPETAADLPPVAGIITAGEGNPLSHVQLLARNLGIPNVAVSHSLLEKLKIHAGKPVILAVTRGGAVQLLEDEEQSESGHPVTVDTETAVRIHVNTDKLDLVTRHFIDLADLRADDSGVVVGPKAAKLGELKHYFPDAVADGLAIPFGVFRQLLEQDSPEPGLSMFDWIVRQYRYLESLPVESRELRAKTEQFRNDLYQWLLHADPGEDFTVRLRHAMEDRFGEDSSYGVFVRSDTNVEDLPGFTGAGLNLTVPNVVGTDNIRQAISKVWASPFTARAYAWRQALMDQPEHVYPAILLMQGVNVDKSGVLVTRDIDTGDRDWISLAVNEGVGGAVDGQAAESLRIRLDDGETRLLAQASASVKRRLSPAGGIEELPVEGKDYVLTRDEIEQLLNLTRELPLRFPPIVDDLGKPAAADIEFGFIGGKLQLFQIRPFLDDARLEKNQYLRSLDPDPGMMEKLTVNLDESVNIK